MYIILLKVINYCAFQECSVHVSDEFPKKTLCIGVGGVSSIQFPVGFLEFPLVQFNP